MRRALSSGRTRGRERVEAIVWIGLLVFVALRVWPQIAAAVGADSAASGQPAFELATITGATVSSDELRGHVVLVNFWATWCPPCRMEMPGFQSVYDRRRADGFVILGIAADAGTAGVERFLTERGITYPVAMATPSVTRAFGGPRTLPTSFLIDRSGRIRYRVEGIFTSVALDRAVQRLLSEPYTPVPRAAAEDRNGD